MMMKREELKQLFTGYWHYLAVKTASKLNLFDLIEEGIDRRHSLSEAMNVDIQALSFLLEALLSLALISKKNDCYSLSQSGEFLTERHSKSMKYACILWGEEHLTAWQNLEYTIKKGKPAFDNCYGKPFFDYLRGEKESNRIYHKAMFEYARDDYEQIAEVVDFSKHQKLMDVGGGLGAILMAIRKRLSIPLYLLETENVIKLLPNNYSKIFSAISGDFFKEIPTLADAIIMSRVIHDWNDEKAKQILNNVYNALPQDGVLYLIEIIKENLKDGAALLNLNMQLMCNSNERTQYEYKALLEMSGFKFIEVKPLNELQSIIICKK
jgi:hypothetical protein